MRNRGLAAVRRPSSPPPARRRCRPCQAIEDSTHPDPPDRFRCGSTGRSRRSTSPVLVYFHGGGMVMGSNHSFEPLARDLAAPAAPPWCRVDYRLAPEYPPPAQFDDAYAATDMGRRQCRRPRRGRQRGSPSSATAPVAHWLRRWRWRPGTAPGPPSCAQVLLYPGLDRDMAAQSITSMPDAPMLTPRRHLLHARARRRAAGPPHDPYRIPAYAADLVRIYRRPSW